MNRLLLIPALLALALILPAAGSPTLAREPARAHPAALATSASAWLPSAGGCFTAALSGASEVPPNDSAVTGYATLALAATGDSATYYITYTGELSGTETAAHFHRGAAGVSGPVVYALPAGNPKTGAQTFTISDTDDLLAGNLYVNIHSTNFAGGEVRGQLRPSSACFAARLGGDQEVPANTSTVTGTGTFALSPDMGTLVYDIRYTGELSGTETAAHFHRGAAGVSGPVVYALPAGNPKTGAQTFTISDTDDLLAGNLYVNIHSTNFAGGEVRGQILPATSCFATTLSGAEEVPPTSSGASGTGTFRLSADQTELSYHIRTTGVISETAAHIHVGPVGMDGSVNSTLPTGDDKQGTATLTITDTQSLWAGQLYVNVHTSDNPNGEIRGQIGASACQGYLPQVHS